MVGGGGASPAIAQQDDPRPVLKVLGQFTAADVPARGPTEPGPTTRTWWDPTTVPSASTLPAPVGSGLAQHPMLYAGEGYNRGRQSLGQTAGNTFDRAATGAERAANTVADKVDDLKDRVDGNPASRPGPDATDSSRRLDGR